MPEESRPTRAGPRRQRGSATVLALAATTAVVAAAWAVLVLAVALEARHRAAAAADLAALAAAGRPPVEAPSCDRAAAVATANGARLASCAVAGDVVEVRVAVSLPPIAGFLPEPVRRARAGPSSALPSGE